MRLFLYFLLFALFLALSFFIAMRYELYVLPICFAVGIAIALIGEIIRRWLKDDDNYHDGGR